MDATLERQVRQRAGGRCEYCRLPQAASGVPFELDHITARSIGPYGSRQPRGELHGYCNGYKGPNLAAETRDRQSHAALPSATTQMGHHFQYEGSTLIGRTAIGRTTIEVLRINMPSSSPLAIYPDGRWDVLAYLHKASKKPWALSNDWPV